jgi:peptide deformylase
VKAFGRGGNMTVLDIITIEEDKENILSTPAEEVKPREIEDLQELIDNMIETVDHTKALGLAAPQVGVNKRIFVLEDGTVAINPGSMMGTGKVTSHSEGCLSVPNKRFNVKRIRHVIVRCLDRFGKPQKLSPRKKLYSIAIQHEIDHLNGKLISNKGKLIQ